MGKRNVNLPTMVRVARVAPESLDVEKRTFDIIWTTKKGGRVLRQRFLSEDFHEELGLETKHVRMGRLQSGSAPFLDQHGFSDKRGVQSAIGVIEKAKLIPREEGRATVRLSKREDVEPIFQDIKDRILQNVSVGYAVYRFIELEDKADDGLRVFRAIDWEPFEISLVTAGADSEAHIRSNEQHMTQCIFETRENKEIPTRTIESQNEIVAKTNEVRQTDSTGGNEMTPEEIKKMQEDARAEGRAEGHAEGSKEGADAENKRQVEIRSIVRKVKLEDLVADEFIKDGKTVDEVRTLAIDLVAEKDEKSENQTRSTNVDVGEDLGRAGRIEGMTSAILHRFRRKDLETRNEGGQIMMLKGYELTESGREYAYFSLIDMARASLEAQGVATGMMPRHVIADTVLGNSGNRALHSTSDFPEILANVANKTLRNGYLAAPQTFMPFTNEVFESDFKEIARINLGDAEKLDKLEEGSEVKRGTIGEAAEKYRIEEFAKIIALSRKTIVNDDLNAFTRIPERMGRRAKDLESDLVWEIFKLNAALADSIALFASAHGNLSVAPGAPSEAGLNEFRAAMRRQVGLNGAEISLTPAWIFVPPAHETATEKLIATTRPNNAADVNPFGPQGRTTLRMDVEPRLETGTGGSLTAWFGTADKGQIDMIELARLEGTDGPQMQTRDGFDVNGVELKIMHDVAAKALDHRGLFKNAGA